MHIRTQCPQTRCAATTVQPPNECPLPRSSASSRSTRTRAPSKIPYRHLSSSDLTLALKRIVPHCYRVSSSKECSAEISEYARIRQYLEIPLHFCLRVRNKNERKISTERFWCIEIKFILCFSKACTQRHESSHRDVQPKMTLIHGSLGAPKSSPLLDLSGVGG